MLMLMAAAAAAVVVVERLKSIVALPLMYELQYLLSVLMMIIDGHDLSLMFVPDDYDVIDNGLPDGYNVVDVASFRLISTD